MARCSRIRSLSIAPLLGGVRLTRGLQYRPRICECRFAPVPVCPVRAARGRARGDRKHENDRIECRGSSAEKKPAASGPGKIRRRVRLEETDGPDPCGPEGPDRHLPGRRGRRDLPSEDGRHRPRPRHGEGGTPCPARLSTSTSCGSR
jgi:hypothetical protein